MTPLLPFRLLLLRHAHSSWAVPGQRDHSRPLDPRGENEARRLADYMTRLDSLPDVVVCSTAVRATQTLEILKPSLVTNPRIVMSDNLYALGVDAYFDAARTAHCEGTLMLVGHNPMIEDFALSLAGDGEKSAIAALRAGMPTCGLAVIALTAGASEIANGCGQLTDLVAPETLSA